MSMGMDRWRPRRFRVGKMRERINVQQATEDISTGQPVRTWSNLYANEPAAYEPATGRETVRGRQVEANVTAVFQVHRKDSYSTELRIQHDGLTYGIVAVIPVDGGRRYLELHCRAIPN